MCGKSVRNFTQYYLGVVYLLYMFYFKLSCVNCCLVVLCVLLWLSCVHCCHLMCSYFLCYVCIVVFTLDAGLLVRS